MESTVTIADGSCVGYYEYGDPTGAPVMALHGVPACGAGFDWADDAARDRGLRIIAPDRPGVGQSDRRAGHRIADYPDHLASVADALGIDRFVVWGYSGGGPYAAACAALLSERLESTAIAAGMGEIGVVAVLDDFESTDRQMLSMARRHPRVARAIMAGTAAVAKRSPGSAVKSFAKQLSATDRVVIAERGDPAATMALFTRAFQHGAAGVVDDYAALAQPWEFDLSAATGRVSVWHGSDDPMVPIRHSQALVDQLPHATLTTWEGEGHLGAITHVADILDSLA
jgi:pimeloyl-ACP methyl ester carboxylesterase